MTPGARAELSPPRLEPRTPPPPPDVAPVIPLAPSKPGTASPVSWQRIEATLSGPPHVLAVFNHKGGTGKTTTAVTLAAALASRGKQVLLIDTDGQGNVAISLGLTPTRTLYHVLVMGQPFTSVVLSPRPGLDVLAANETLAAAELYLAGRAQRDRILATRLASCRESYEHIIIDCSPSLSLMSQNTLAFADAVLCPVACDYLSLVGVRQVLRTIKQVNRVLGHPVRLWGVLPTMFDTRARVCHEALHALQEHFKDRCLEPIHTNIKAKEAPAQGATLLEYAPEARCTADYLRVVDRLLNDQGEQATEPDLRQEVSGDR
ncbi:MAG: ParA family protein [Polyangiaceae bacterium]|nr:ParA family protein [Polyangiaceae bacterium]